MANESTKIMPPEELNSLMDKAHPANKPQGTARKPIAKNQSSSSNKPHSRNSKTNTSGPDFKDKEKKLGTIDNLSRKDLNKIMRAHHPELTVKEKIGEGGFANVFVIEQDDEDEQLALKVIDPSTAYKDQHKGKNTGMTLAQLRNDSSYISICDHIDTEFKINQIIHDRQMQNCVRFYPEYSFIDNSVRDHVGFIVMAKMDGSLLNRPDSLPDTVENWRIAYEMLKDILDDVRFLSEHNGETNIFVRDVKPSNILFKIKNRRIFYYLSDFGMGSIGSGYSSNTKFMSPGFSAPEEAKDIRSDLFSFARTAFYICNGFTLGETEHNLAKQFESEQANEQAYWDNTPPGFRDILQKATAPDPENRYQSVTEMLKDIQSLNFEKEQIYIEQAKDNFAKRLGNVEMRHQEEVEKLQKKIEDLEEELRAGASGNRQEDSSAIEQINALSQQITKKDEEIRTLNAKLQDAEEKATRYEGAAVHVDTRNEKLIEDNKALKEQLEAKDKRIKELEVKEKQLLSIQPKMSQMQEKITELQTEKDNNLKKIEQLQHDASNVEEQSQTIDDLRASLRKANENASALSSENNNLKIEKTAIAQKLDAICKGKSLLEEHPNATLVNHGWDIAKTFIFIFIFAYLYFNQMFEMLPTFFLAYGIAILVSFASSNITLQKQLDNYWRHLALIALGLPSLLFVLVLIEQYLGFSAKYPMFNAPLFGELRLGTISSIVLLILYVLEDSTITYAKNMKNPVADSNDMASLFFGLNSLVVFITIATLVVRLWFPYFLENGGVVHVDNPENIASMLEVEGVYYDEETERVVFDGATIEKCIEFQGDVKIWIKGNVVLRNTEAEAPLIKVKKGTLRIYSDEGSSLTMDNAKGEDIYADNYVYAANSANLHGTFNCLSSNACIYAGINTNITKRTATFQNNSADSSVIIAWSDDSTNYDDTTVVIDGNEVFVRDLGNGFRYDAENKRLVLENMHVTFPMEFKGNITLQLIGENTFVNETGLDIPLIRVTGGSLHLLYEDGSSLKMTNDHGQDLLVDGNIYVQDPRMDGKENRSFTCSSPNACIYAGKGAYMNLADTEVVNNASSNLINYGHQ